MGGDLAPIWTDLASNSNETIEVQCCSTGVVSSTIKTCGNGISCKNICGPNDSGKFVYAVPIWHLTMSIQAASLSWPHQKQQIVRYVISACRGRIGAGRQVLLMVSSWVTLGTFIAELFQV